MSDQSLSLSNSASNAKAMKQRVAYMSVLLKWLDDWVTLFPNNPVTEKLIQIYADYLSELSPNQLEIACREAGKMATVFPKPGDILAAFNGLSFLEEAPHNGAEYLTITADHPLEIDRAKRALQYLADKESGLIEDLQPKVTEVTGARFIFKKKGPELTVEQQKEILRKKGFQL